MNDNLRDARNHFAFGENWADYARQIDQGRIAEAVSALERLLDGYPIRDKSFLDIGSGSGLHSLAALELGARFVLAIDIDKNSINATRKVLDKFTRVQAYRVAEASIFDMTPEVVGQFDVVYSWGVLHHTGDMYEAMRRAIALVPQGGLFAFALYRKTWFCWFWKRFKREYSQMSPRGQQFFQWLYITLYRLVYFRFNKDRYELFLKNYRKRGMEYLHDVHDWLGGFPYESISPAEVDQFMTGLGFTRVRSIVQKTEGIAALFGSGCDEYVYRRG